MLVPEVSLADLPWPDATNQMTQETLTDLRSLEQAAEEVKDKYFLGLCTLFVATMEDAKDRIAQLELIFCSQLFPAFQAKVSESNKDLKRVEKLHEDAIGERESITRELEIVRTEEESRRKLIEQELEKLQSEICNEREELEKRYGKEIEGARQENQRLVTEKGQMQEFIYEIVDKAKERQQRYNKIQLENIELHRYCQQLAPEVSRLSSIHDQLSGGKINMPPQLSSTEASAKLPNADPMKDFDRSLRGQPERRNDESSRETLKRGLLSSEAEKEKKVLHDTLIKLQVLKKRYRSLRRQYNVLFRQNKHELHQDRQHADITAPFGQKDAFDRGICSIKRLPNAYALSRGGGKSKCTCRRTNKGAASYLLEKVKDRIKIAPSLDYDCTYSDFLPTAVKKEEIPERQIITGADDGDRSNVNLTVLMSGEAKAKHDCSLVSDSTNSKKELPFQNRSTMAKQRIPEGDESSGVERTTDAPKDPIRSHSSSFQQSQTKPLPSFKDTVLLDSRLEGELESNMILSSDLQEPRSCDILPAKKTKCSGGKICATAASGRESCDRQKVNQCCVDDNGRHGEDHATSKLQQLKRGAVEPYGLAQDSSFPFQKRAFLSEFDIHAAKSLKASWRNTRSRGDGKGIDPHDDFLDTPHDKIVRSLVGQDVKVHHDLRVPLEANRKTSEETAIKGEQPLDNGAWREVSFSQITTQGNAAENVEAVVHENAPDIANQEEHEYINRQSFGSKVIRGDIKKQFEKTRSQSTGSSDIKPPAAPTGKAKASSAVKKGAMYKYVEPVRKKDEREKLQGVECNQCKKFYDAVLRKDDEGALSERCEHHNAVSRHRYRYVPPATPEGFWNIGFDSSL